MELFLQLPEWFRSVPFRGGTSALPGLGCRHADLWGQSPWTGMGTKMVEAERAGWRAAESEVFIYHSGPLSIHHPLMGVCKSPYIIGKRPAGPNCSDTKWAFFPAITSSALALASVWSNSAFAFCQQCSSVFLKHFIAQSSRVNHAKYKVQIESRVDRILEFCCTVMKSSLCRRSLKP